MGIFYIRHTMIEPDLRYSMDHTRYKLERIVNASPLLKNEKIIEIEFINYGLKTVNKATSVFFLDLFLRTQLPGYNNTLIFDNPFDISADVPRGLRNAVAYENYFLYPQVSNVFFLDLSPYPYSRYAEELFEKLGMSYSPLGDARNPIQKYFIDTVKVMKQLREDAGIIFLGHDKEKYSGYDERTLYVSTNAIAEYLCLPEKSIRQIVNVPNVKKTGLLPLSNDQKELLKDAQKKDYERISTGIQIKREVIRFHLERSETGMIMNQI